MTEDELQKEELRGLFATSILVIFVAALLDGTNLFPPNFQLNYQFYDFRITNLIVPFRAIAEFYTATWVIYAFMMSLAYSDAAAAQIIRKLSPRLLQMLIAHKPIDKMKLTANLAFFSGLIVVTFLGLLLFLWNLWSIGIR